MPRFYCLKMKKNRWTHWPPFNRSMEVQPSWPSETFLHNGSDFLPEILKGKWLFNLTHGSGARSLPTGIRETPQICEVFWDFLFHLDPAGVSFPSPRAFGWCTATFWTAVIGKVGWLLKNSANHRVLFFFFLPVLQAKNLWKEWKNKYLSEISDSNYCH